VETTSLIIVVDEVAFPVRFQGYDRPLEVLGPDGGTVHLQPWTYRDHMEALRLSLQPTERGLELDTETFCRCVLERSGQGQDGLADLTGMVLWWAGGGEQRAAKITPDGCLELGPARVWLRAWTGAERIRAIADCLTRNEAGESFDIVNYLDAMVRTCIRVFDPVVASEELDAAATAALIEAVVNLNVPEQLGHACR